MKLSRTRLAYTIGVVVVSAILGAAAPVFAASLSGVNSHSAQVFGATTYPGKPGYQDHFGPGYLFFWTNNLTLASNIPPPGTTVTSIITNTDVNGTIHSYNCYGPNISERVPAGSNSPLLNQSSLPKSGSIFTAYPPGYVLVVIDLSLYCQPTSMTNG